jgi:arsenate reductase
MAAAIARALAPASIRISSAGTRPAAIHPLAVEALADLGFDARGAPSRSFEELAAEDVDVVITLCADDIGATFPGGARRVHWPLPDPTEVGGNEAVRLDAFRQIRDELVRRLVVVFGGPRVLAPAA